MASARQVIDSPSMQDLSTIDCRRWFGKMAAPSLCNLSAHLQLRIAAQREASEKENTLRAPRQ
jgi:hypothetical protein